MALKSCKVEDRGVMENFGVLHNPLNQTAWILATRKR
jgi:hypothetical protein